MEALEMVKTGANTTLIGLGVVFSVLIILSFSTWLLNKIVAAMEGSKKQKAAAPAAPAPAAAPAPKAEAADGSISNATLAAITAAVVTATGKCAHNLRFTSIRRTGTNWSNFGNQELIESQKRYTKGGN